MDKLLPALLMLCIVALVFAVMWRSWRRRTSRDAGHGATDVPTGFRADDEFAIQYVATTRADEPLERLAPPGLGFRGFGSLSIAPVGVVIAVTGERSAFVPAPSLRSVGTSNVAIDRAVEPEGLVRISWTLPDETPCDSYVRFREPRDQHPALDALTHLIPPHRAHSGSESENTR